MTAIRCKPEASRRSLARLSAINRDKLMECLKYDLTGRQYEMMEMYYIEGLEQKEIAARLGVVPSTVCRTLARAHRRMGRAARYV